MSLDYDLSKIKDLESVCFWTVNGKRHLRPVTYFLIHHMMSIMVGKITEENVDEILARTFMYRRVLGDEFDIFDWDDAKDEESKRKLTREDVVAHIGLSTNVSTEPRETFISRRIIRSLEYDANYEYKLK